MTAESAQPRIYEVSDNCHTVQWGWVDYWIDIGEGDEEPRRMSLEERNERATNVATVLMKSAAGAASSEEFKKLFDA